MLISPSTTVKRCKGKLARKEKCGDKNSRRKAAAAAKAWQTFKNVSLVMAFDAFSRNGTAPHCDSDARNRTNMV